jgi:molecular chaperone DnaJ
MQLKDYYKMLKVQPTATSLQIKKSFRQLALLYHPDKNPGNAIAEATFREIQEAYETLINPEKREEYNYKRWYSRSINEQFIHEPLSAASVLKECTRLNEYMQTVNVLRVDFDGLSYHIRQLLSDTNINILQQSNDESINADIIEKTLQSASVLPFGYIQPITNLLMKITGNNEELAGQIQTFVVQQKQKNTWQKYRATCVVAVTILLCWIIYRISK